jgi:polyketide synthase PksJ
VLEDLEEGLSTAEGLQVLDRVLRSRLEHVLVSTRDLEWRVAAGLEQSRVLLGGPAAEAGADRPKHPRPELMNAYAAPRTDVEQRLAEIWQDVLGFEKVGVHDNFFELGGDSLLITRVHTRFTESFDAEMSVADLLQYPTIADLARRLEEDGGQREIAFEAVQERAKGQKDALKRRKEKMKRKARAAGVKASGAGSGRSARASLPGPRSS